MERSNLRPRNVTIDLWKFVYAWFVVFYHIYKATGSHFISGRFGVEFFLLTAGVFFFRGLESRPDTTPGRHIGRRFMRFFPWNLTAFIFAFLVIRVVIGGNTAPGQIANHMSSDIWEALLVKMNGMNDGKGFLNSPAWTLSSMFLVETVLVCCYCSFRKPLVNVILPVSLIIGFGYWRMTKTGAVEDWIGFTTFGVLRTWLVYGCGYYCLKLSQRLAGTDLTRLAKLLLTALETLCHAGAIWVMLNRNSRYWQWCVLLAFFAAVAVEMSGQSLWTPLLQRFSRITGFLSSLSLSVYLMHRPVTRYFETLYPEPDAYYAHLLPLLAAIAVCSLAQYFLLTGLIRLWRKNRDKIRALFIQSA